MRAEQLNDSECLRSPMQARAAAAAVRGCCQCKLALRFRGYFSAQPCVCLSQAYHIHTPRTARMRSIVPGKAETLRALPCLALPVYLHNYLSPYLPPFKQIVLCHASGRFEAADRHRDRIFLLSDAGSSGIPRACVVCSLRKRGNLDSCQARQGNGKARQSRAERYLCCRCHVNGVTKGFSRAFFGSDGVCGRERPNVSDLRVGWSLGLNHSPSALPSSAASCLSLWVVCLSPPPLSSPIRAWGPRRDVPPDKRVTECEIEISHEPQNGGEGGEVRFVTPPGQETRDTECFIDTRMMA